MGHKRVI